MDGWMVLLRGLECAKCGSVAPANFWFGGCWVQWLVQMRVVRKRLGTQPTSPQTSRWCSNSTRRTMNATRQPAIDSNLYASTGCDRFLTLNFAFVLPVAAVVVPAVDLRTPSLPCPRPRPTRREPLVDAQHALVRYKRMEITWLLLLPIFFYTQHYILYILLLGSRVPSWRVLFVSKQATPTWA